MTHTIGICISGSCRRNFSEDTLKATEKLLGIQAGETTADGKITLQKTGCLGECSLGPCVIVDSRLHTKIFPRQMKEIVDDLKNTE